MSSTPNLYPYQKLAGRNGDDGELWSVSPFGRKLFRRPVFPRPMIEIEAADVL